MHTNCNIYIHIFTYQYKSSYSPDDVTNCRNGYCYVKEENKTNREHSTNVQSTKRCCIHCHIIKFQNLECYCSNENEK